MTRLTSFTIFLFAAVVLLIISPLTSHAQSGVPLADLLRPTHIHGLAVDHPDSGRQLIATHHGLHALRLDTGMVELVSER